MRRTEIVVTAEELQELFDCGDDEPFDLQDVIPVCSGEWRRESSDRWRAWDYEGNEGPLLIVKAQS